MFIIFGLKSMIKQLLNLVYGFLHLKCIIKQLLDEVFVICKIINVSVGLADTSYLDFDDSAYHKGMVEKTEYGVRSTEYGVRSTECGVRSTECGVRSTESVSVKVFL